MRGELISPESVHEWVIGIYGRSVPSSWPEDRGPVNATNNRISFFGMPTPYRELQWINYDAMEVRIWCVPPNSPLGKLAKLSDKLTKRWDWSGAHATEFVVADTIPPRPAIRQVTTSSRSGWDKSYGSYSWPYVSLTVDAQVSPEELAAWWRSLRHDLGVSGNRRVSEDSVDLALFAMRRDDSTTWNEDCTEWNSSTDGKMYASWRHYRTAAIRAIENLNTPVGFMR